MVHLHAKKSPTLDTVKLLHRDFWLNYVRKLQEFQGNSCHLFFIGSLAVGKQKITQAE